MDQSRGELGHCKLTQNLGSPLASVNRVIVQFTKKEGSEQDPAQVDLGSLRSVLDLFITPHCFSLNGSVHPLVISPISLSHFFSIMSILSCTYRTAWINLTTPVLPLTTNPQHYPSLSLPLPYSFSQYCLLCYSFYYHPHPHPRCWCS